jgi:predicted HD phosphohydrolase
VEGVKMTTGDTTLGTVAHESIGADFLGQLGVPEEVASLARWHVAAKRYLCFRDAEYHASGHFLFRIFLKWLV